MTACDQGEAAAHAPNTPAGGNGTAGPRLQLTSTLPNLRDVALTFAARAVAMIGPFGVSIITARLLGPEDRGRYFFILSLAQIAAQIANLGLHSSNTYLAAARREIVGRLAVNSLIVAALVAPAVTVLVILAVVLPQHLGLVAASDSVGSAAFLAVLLAPLLVAFLYLSNLAVAIGRLQLFNGLTLLSGAAAIVAAAFVGLLDGGIAAYLVAAAGALLFSNLVGGACLLSGSRMRPAFDMALFREGVLYAVRAYLATLLGFLLMRVGVVALQQQASFAEVGQFSVATQLAEAMILLPATVTMLLFPNLVRAAPGERWPAMWKSFRWLGGAMALLLTIAALVIPFALPLVFGRSYQPAVPLMLAMLPTVLIVTLVSVVSQYLSAEGFPWRQVGAWLAAFLVQAVLSFWLSSSMGGMGVAIALAISNGLVLVLLIGSAFSLRRARLAVRHADALAGGNFRCK